MQAGQKEHEPYNDTRFFHPLAPIANAVGRKWSPPMPYEMQIDRANPGCIIFMVDQSNSMLDGIAGTQRPKLDTVATAINRVFAELITSCEKGEEKPRNYFEIGL